MAKKEREIKSEVGIGDLRVTFYSVPCGPTTLIAQQMKSESGIYTFRKWNPKKVDVPFGVDNDPDLETVCVLCVCCPCSRVVDGCF